MQTIAQQIKWNFAKEGDLVIRNAKGNPIYLEHSDGFWVKRTDDEKGNVIYYESSDGFWYKRTYDEKGNEIYYETSDGYWSKSKYDEKGNEIYYETSYGEVIDKRPKCENKVVDIDGVKYKLVKL